MTDRDERYYQGNREQRPQLGARHTRLIEIVIESRERRAREAAEAQRRAS